MSHGAGPSREAVVVGAGFVGVSVAIHLQQRGWQVRLVDRGLPGSGTSFGNAGIIQGEAVSPYAFPRQPRAMLSILRNRGTDVRYHARALPGAARALALYWWHSSRTRHAVAGRDYATLIARALEEHGRLIESAGAADLVRRDGWYDLYRSAAGLAAGRAAAEAARADHGVPSDVLGPDEVAALEPHLTERMAGAVHWRDTWTVRDPAALAAAYARAFEALGGEMIRADMRGLERAGGSWRIATDGAPIEAPTVVLATGPWTGPILRRLGFRPPLFVKRGYHMHYAGEPDRPLGHWIADLETGFLLAPMRAGIRLTTGAEIARQDAPPTPRQLDAAEAVARRMFPLGPRADPEPWVGSRPCSADMRPLIGRVPRHDGLWLAAGHGHQGLTLGPVTGRLLAEEMSGEVPHVDLAPFAPARFARARRAQT